MWLNAKQRWIHQKRWLNCIRVFEVDAHAQLVLHAKCTPPFASIQSVASMYCVFFSAIKCSSRIYFSKQMGNVFAEQIQPNRILHEFKIKVLLLICLYSQCKCDLNPKYSQNNPIEGRRRRRKKFEQEAYKKSLFNNTLNLFMSTHLSMCKVPLLHSQTIRNG